MIQRQQFIVETAAGQCGASGYLNEIDSELLVWHLEVDEVAVWYEIVNKPPVIFNINEVRYSGVSLTSWLEEIRSGDRVAVPAAHFAFKNKC